MIWLAGAVLALTLAMVGEAILGPRRLARLAEVPRRAEAGAPRVSIVVAARDEARSIETAARAMLAQDYPDLEVVVVDDRSSDGTGAILDRLANDHPRLRVIHVTELPPGWLGKNHALEVGAEQASGHWLLFTDADVHLHPDAVSRAVGYAEAHQVDHVVAAPDLELPGFLLQGFGVHFFYSFLIYAKPWRARDPRSWFFVGVGAFNLVRTDAYRAVDGHRRIALRPDDDMKLGKILKRAGFRQDALVGHDMLRVEWYRSFGELVRGLEKNMFAGIEYNPLLSVAGGLAQLAIGVAPVVLAAVATGPARALFLAQTGVYLLALAHLARTIRVTPAVALVYPVITLLFVFVLWRTMFLNLVHGGITWRGTFYPLAALRANRV